jgi:hypothetical protein
MRTTKDPKARLWSLAVLGLAAAALGCARRTSQQDSKDPGPMPNRTLMFLAIDSAAGRSPKGPRNLEILDIQQPFIDLKGESCWKVPFRYQTQFGASEPAIYHGIFWVRRDRLLWAQWDSNKARP